MSWQLEDTRKLIFLYKNHPELWDPSNENYHNNDLKYKLFISMGKKMNRTQLEIRNKIRGLRTMYIREYKRVEAQIQKRGKYNGHVWFGYNMMSFLKPLYDVDDGNTNVEFDIKDEDRSNQRQSSVEDSDDTMDTRTYSPSSWTYEEVIQLMEMYKNYPLLWDPEHEQYNNKHLRLKHIRELAKAFDKTAPEVKFKLKNLRTLFNRTQKKIKKAFETQGKFTGKLWFGYKRMSYLDKEDHQFLIDEDNMDNVDFLEVEDDTDSKRMDHDYERNPWSSDDVIKLISMHKNHPELWKPTHEDYSHKLKRDNALNNIAKALKRDRLDIESKIKNLRTQFLRLHKKINSTRYNGRYKGKLWFGYNHMSYLKNVYNKMKEDQSDEDDFDDSFDLIKHEVYSDEVSRTSIEEEYDYRPPKKIIKKKKRKSSTSDAEDIDPLSILHQKSGQIDKKSKSVEPTSSQYPGTIDEFTVFGQFVTQELKKIKDDYALTMAKNEITKIIFNAQMHQASQKCKEND